jgi:enoyl-CoA hydratase/carnithine racemase
MEMALTGDAIDAERAAALGLVNAVTEPGEALAGALALAARIVDNAPLAVAGSKRIIDESPGWAPGEAWQRQAEVADAVRDSADALEGARAFAEKRPAVWRGR